MNVLDILILIGIRMTTLIWQEKGEREGEVGGDALDGGVRPGSIGVRQWGRLLDGRCPSGAGEEGTSVR